MCFSCIELMSPSKDIKDSLKINTSSRCFKPILCPIPLLFAIWCSSCSALLCCCISLISGQGFNPLIANWAHISTPMLLWCAATLSMWEVPHSLTLGPGSGAALQGCTHATNTQVTHSSQHQPPLRFPAEQKYKLKLHVKERTRAGAAAASQVWVLVLLLER